MRIDSDANAEVEAHALPGDSKNFPVETVAELRVLRTEKYSSIALVTESRSGAVPGDLAVSRVGQ